MNNTSNLKEQYTTYTIKKNTRYTTADIKCTVHVGIPK
jgi:hypothetical protein